MYYHGNCLEDLGKNATVLWSSQMNNNTENSEVGYLIVSV
jgi:hypothetical protein